MILLKSEITPRKLEIQKNVSPETKKFFPGTSQPSRSGTKENHLKTETTTEAMTKDVKDTARLVTLEDHNRPLRKRDRRLRDE
jgi:hypothetical protein